jgi:hypothetical protein
MIEETAVETTAVEMKTHETVEMMGSANHE